MRFVQRRHDGLLDLGAGEPVRRQRQCVEVESLGLCFAPCQVDGEDLGARRRVRQVDEKDLVGRPLPDQLRRLLDIVGGAE
ncbi:MAG: hypothetical protein IPM60_15425 [Rhodospirillales bacterium]|nr:hypothetical protein [Rhodospirillales bacterium]